MSLTLAGIDLQFAMLNLIDRVFGIDALIAFVTRFLLSATFSLFETGISFVPFAAFVVAMHIRPVRMPLWALTAAGVLTAAYTVGWFSLVGLLLTPKNFDINWSIFYVGAVRGIGCWMFAACVYFASRSVLLTALYAGWPLVAMGIDFASFHTGIHTVFTLKLPDWSVGVNLWTLLAWSLLGGSPILWSAWGRRNARRCSEHVCRSCGYSRDGLAEGSLCPECGHAPEAVDADETRNHSELA